MVLNDNMTNLTESEKKFRTCDICEKKYEIPINEKQITISGDYKCPYCEKILDLKNVLIQYSRNFWNLQFSDPLFSKNMIKDGEDVTEFGKVETFTIDKSNNRVNVIGRTSKIKALIERIKKAREYIYFRLEQRFSY